MYYYLSFLRPPPASALPSSSIAITPQITNDLRTEFFEQTVDILYSWTPVDRTFQRTAATKLTTWKGSVSAYKPLSVHLPQSARLGQKWILSLFCSPHISPNIRLGTSQLHPLGVSSLPIDILRLKTLPADAPKQDEIERTLLIPSPGSHDGETSRRPIVIRERTSYDLDKKIWDSGIALTAWFSEALAGYTTSQGGRELQTAISATAPHRILELGAGTGLVSLVVSALMGQTTHAATVTVTDLASAIPLLAHNIAANQSQFARIQVTSAVLDWDTELPENIISAGPFDMILMSDVTYNTASFPALLKTLQSLLRLSQGAVTETLTLLAYKERDPGERELWSMAEEMGIHFAKLDEAAGHGGQPIELWSARYLADKTVPT